MIQFAKNLLGIEVASLVPADLNNLVKKTQILINTIGPYHLYGTPVVEACANNGTHYLDVTGESPWVLDMIKNYHELAKCNNAIIIPEIGIESSPTDLLTWALATEIRQKCGTGTREVVASLHEMKSRPSGGTLATILTIMDTYSTKDIINANSGNWSSSPIKRTTRPPPSSSLVSKLFGVRTIPNVGIVTTSLNAGPNIAVVQRSWGLLDGGKYYGPNFQIYEYMTVRNFFAGAVFHIALAIGTLALALPPIRWLIKTLVYAPGQGAAKEATMRDSIEYRAVATADQDGHKPRQSFGRFRYEGGIYHLTGIFLAEAAMVLLEDESLVKKLGGGLLTPAMLGQQFIDRMTRAGILLETNMLPE